MNETGVTRNKPRRPSSLRGFLFAALGWAAGTTAAATPAGASAQGLEVLLGERPERARAIVALLAMHPFESQFPEVEWTGGVGVQLDQWFAATFVNSYSQRSFIGGLVRSWVSGSAGPVDLGLGYRVGVVSGYDERLFDLAGRTPVLPFIGFLAWLDLEPVSVDVFYVYRAIAIEGGIRF